MSEQEKVTVDVEYTNAEAFVVERVLDSFLGTGVDEVKGVKGPYRLSQNLKKLSDALKTYKEKLGEIGESHIATEEYEDEDGETKTRKVQATVEEKQEDGSWKSVPAVGRDGSPQYKIADPEAYAKDMRDLGEETFSITLSRVPLSMLDGAKNTGQLFFHCDEFIYED